MEKFSIVGNWNKWKHHDAFYDVKLAKNCQFKRVWNILIENNGKKELNTQNSNADFSKPI